jgi:hypothetical protein
MNDEGLVCEDRKALARDFPLMQLKMDKHNVHLPQRSSLSCCFDTVESLKFKALPERL